MLRLVETLGSHPFVRGLPPHHIEKLAGLAAEVRYQDEQVIFRQGDVSNLFCLVISGKIGIEVNAPGRTFRIQTIGEGEVFGWSSVLGGRDKQFQARALGTVRGLAFDGNRLREACEGDCSLGYAIMNRLLRVVADRLQALRLQLIDVYTPPGAKQA
ncbi:MAG: Crp/Fnr family transcriptional regulator [Bryobacteraceae bacterium]